jgi:Domain of unknown function (DUF4942)
MQTTKNNEIINAIYRLACAREKFAPGTGLKYFEYMQTRWHSNEIKKNINDLKYVDRICWYYLINLYELQKYMLTTDYEKIRKEIQNFQTPDFTIKNIKSWIEGLNALIYENVQNMIKQVFKSITEKTYFTGSSNSNKKKKKRNNNGIDRTFILTTNDYSQIFGFGQHSPTITDDLEKVCYILSGEKLPNSNCKYVMKSENKTEFENKHFKIKVCKNGNTHYWLGKEILDRFNFYGSGSGIIGENIRIKIFDKCT